MVIGLLLSKGNRNYPLITTIKFIFLYSLFTSMRINKLPDILDIKLKSKEERINSYRKFLADLRLNRLYFHLLILDFFSNLDNKDNKQIFSQELKNYFVFFNEMDNWLNLLRKNGIYDEFKEQCLQETKAIEQIIQSYESRIKK